MRSMILRLFQLIALLAMPAACGSGGGSSSSAVCTKTGNMELYTSVSMTTLMTSITVTAAQNSLVTSVPIFVWYQTPPVEVILEGYPYGGVNPSTYGISVTQFGVGTDNPLEFRTSFDTNRSQGTYQAVLRFVATDLAMSVPLACQDVLVTFTVN